MTIAISSPLTGGAQTGLTSPTYTLTADQAPDVNGKQYAVTALGGTQTGVTAHSASSPFTLTYWKTKIFRMLGKPNPVTGMLSNVPYNQQKFITRKGMLPLAGQPYSVGDVTTVIRVPAGAETADPANVRAMLSAHFGAVWQQSAGVGDTVVSNLIG